MPIDHSQYPKFIEAVVNLRKRVSANQIEPLYQRLAWSLDDIDALEAAMIEAEPISAPPVAVPTHDSSAVELIRPKNSVAEFARQIREGETRAVDIARESLDAARAWRHLNAFTALDTEDVMRQAEAIDHHAKQRAPLGPLAGVPVAIKDLMPVAGYRCTGGTLAREPRMAKRDAPVVAKLREAGAIIFGTANLHELAYGVTSANPHFGAVMNPHFPGRVPGGSSGGSGAIVAANIAPLAVGSDTGGSIRIPAACCGIVGFKPTYGLVDKTDAVPLAWSLDHLGPLARSVDDAATMLEVMAGWPEGSTSQRSDTRPSICVLEGYFSDNIATPVSSRLHSVETLLRDAGAKFTHATVDEMRYATGAQFVTICSEATQANWDVLAQPMKALGEDVRLRLELGQFFLATEYVKAQRARTQIRAALLNALRDADVFLIPTLPCTPPESGKQTVTVGEVTRPVAAMLTRFTSPFNMMGLPALSIPCGYDAEGLPISVQLVGRPGADAKVLTVGRWVEAQLARA